MPLPSRRLRTPPTARRPRGPRHRRDRRTGTSRSRSHARRGRDRRPARTRRAQARSALRRHRRRRAIRSPRSCRSISPRREPRISPTSPARCRRSTGASTRIVHTAALLGSLGPIEHQSFDAWLATTAGRSARADRADARAAAAAARRARMRSVVFTLDTRGEDPTRVLGCLCGRQGRRCRRWLAMLADEWENAPNLRVNGSRARTDALAAARTDASGRGHHALAAAGSLRAAVSAPARPASRKPKAASVIDAQAWLAGRRPRRRVVAGRFRIAVAQQHAQAPEFIGRQRVGQHQPARASAARRRARQHERRQPRADVAVRLDDRPRCAGRRIDRTTITRRSTPSSMRRDRARMPIASQRRSARDAAGARTTTPAARSHSSPGQAAPAIAAVAIVAAASDAARRSAMAASVTRRTGGDFIAPIERAMRATRQSADGR